MRYLFIGLGGTGGEVLQRLRAMMPEKELENARYLHLDTSRRMEEHSIRNGIESIRISSADTVEDVAAELGPEDGVYDWLPGGENEGPFLTSFVDDGAAQNRYKSRLCLARFLSKRTNDLAKFLDQGKMATAEAESLSLRIIIVSSLAGGTGSGAFLDVALFIRKYMEEQDVRITGMFALPELFVRVNREDETKVRAMYANAYAAIRELNAMNLCVSGSRVRTNDYGKSINIKIDTKSEGLLFDSNDPKFISKYNSKPFDLIYFFDRTNSSGRILGSLDEYYQVMADVAYTRLYSQLEQTIEDDESNEMDKRSQIPTAIYGGAGYAKIVYPYEDVLHYLAVRRISEEIDGGWTLCESAWRGYKERSQREAQRNGLKWTEKEGERENNFISTLSSALKRPSSNLGFLKPQIMIDGKDRAEAYVEKLEAMAAAQFGGPSSGGRDGEYSLAAEESVKKVRDELTKIFNRAKALGNNDPLAALEKAETMLPQLKSYKAALIRAIDTRASALADAILPYNEDGKELPEMSTPEANLHTALLKLNNNDLHPLAARYLLYRLRRTIRTRLEGPVKEHTEEKIAQKLDAEYKKVSLFFDDKPDDGMDIDVSDYLQSLKKKYRQILPGEKNRNRLDLEDFLDQIGKCMESCMLLATKEMMYKAWSHTIKLLDALIGQYESFFENLTSLALKLELSYRAEQEAHENASGGHLFVGASSEMKDYYYRSAPGISDAIEGDRDEISAMEGKEIFESMLWRANNRLRMQQEAADRSLVYQETEEDYSDLNEIFDRVISRYVDSLRKSADYLKMDAALALVRTGCRELNITENRLKELKPSDKQRVLFNNYVKELCADLLAKSRPLIYYKQRNTERYYEDEKENVSIEYCHLTVSKKTAETLSTYFSGAASEIDLSGFAKVTGLDIPPIVLEEDQWGGSSPFEIVAFQAVHCLQPTQVTKFHELQENAYYRYYREKVNLAVRENQLSGTPHLDKRWYLRGAMPFISRNLELQWRSKIMKAFLFVLLARDVGFTTDGIGTKCFLIKRDGRMDLIHWPENELVLRGNLSRVLEYLSEDEAFVEELAGYMDDAVKHQVRLLANDTESPAAYKAGMTKNGMLLRLRTDLLAALRTPPAGSVAGQNAVRPVTEKTEKEQARAAALQEKIRRIQKAISGEEEITAAKSLPDRQASLGGLLEVAWLVHQSEEKLGEDRDFGEALLACGREIVDQICQGMYGGTMVNPKSTQYDQYRKLYNSFLEKFVRDYVIDVLRSGTLVEKYSAYELEKMLRQNSDGVTEEDENGVVFSLGASRVEFPNKESNGYPGLQNIPQAIRDSDAFVWIQKYWTLK